MKKYIYIILSLVISSFCVSCSLEDDIDEMFIGKTWHIVGGELNGQSLNGPDVNHFYADANSYRIIFNSNSFSGTLANGDSFSGTWVADGKSRSIRLNVKQQPQLETPFERNVYNVLKNVTYYEGDSEILTLCKDKENFIRMNHER